MAMTATRTHHANDQEGHAAAFQTYKLLFIGPVPVPPRNDPRKNLRFHNSEMCEGDCVFTIWGSQNDNQVRSLPSEIETRLQRIELEVGIGPNTFSYLYGAPDSFNAITGSCLDKAGVRHAFNYDGGYCRFDRRDPYGIPRIAV